MGSRSVRTLQTQVSVRKQRGLRSLPRTVADLPAQDQLNSIVSVFLHTYEATKGAHVDTVTTNR
jgi:hypothetical protein